LIDQNDFQIIVDINDDDDDGDDETKSTSTFQPPTTTPFKQHSTFSSSISTTNFNLNNEIKTKSHSDRQNEIDNEIINDNNNKLLNHNDNEIFGVKQYTLSSKPTETSTIDEHLVDSYLKPSESCGAPFTAGSRFLVYHSSDHNCPGEGHQLFELACALGESMYLNRTLVLNDRFCVGRSHLERDADDLTTRYSDYFDIKDMFARGVTVTTTSVLESLYSNECLHWYTLKKHKKVSKSRFVFFNVCDVSYIIGSTNFKSIQCC
jgi:hypothetical protein